MTCLPQAQRRILRLVHRRAGIVGDSRAIGCENISERTLIASDAPGSNSNRYSVSASSIHSRDSVGCFDSVGPDIQSRAPRKLSRYLDNFLDLFKLEQAQARSHVLVKFKSITAGPSIDQVALSRHGFAFKVDRLT